MEAVLNFLGQLDQIVFTLWQNVLKIWLSVWWIVLPIALGLIFWRLWLFYIRTSYIRKIKRVLLRVRTPREILKTPKAMEQVFAAAHGSYSFGIRFLEKYWRGRVEDWWSFEILGTGEGVYFYIWLNQIYRNLIESAIYAQYPEAEIEAMEDYIELWPSVLPSKTYEIFGGDLILSRDNPYPLRSYEEFESRVEEEKIDPMAIFLEVCSQLKSGETVWLQIILRPAGERTGVDLPKEAEELIQKIIGREKPAKASWLDAAREFLANLLIAPFGEPRWGKKEEKAKQEKRLTAAEQDIVRAIARKASKVYFQGAIRFLYIDRADSFSRANVAAVMGAFRHLSSLELNSLRPNIKTLTIARFPFKNRKIYYKKRRLYDYYRIRRVPKRNSLFNIEELATVYHYPSATVAAPLIRPLEAKKSGPPPTLPVE